MLEKRMWKFSLLPVSPFVVSDAEIKRWLAMTLRKRMNQNRVQVHIFLFFLPSFIKAIVYGEISGATFKANHR